jgi:hypothetical protein
MPMPVGTPIIDTLIGFPIDDFAAAYEIVRRQTKDADSRKRFPVSYIFKDMPEGRSETDDPVATTLAMMDLFGIAKGVIDTREPEAERALREHSDRFIGRSFVDPNEGVDALRQIVREHETLGTRAVMVFPPATFRRWRSTTKPCIRSMLNVWSSACRCGSPPVSPVRA